MSLNDIKRFASAVRAGAQAARSGETQNPFDGVDEQLRLAFHFGWSAEQPLGDAYYSVEALLRMSRESTDIGRSHGHHLVRAVQSRTDLRDPQERRPPQ